MKKNYLNGSSFEVVCISSIITTVIILFSVSPSMGQCSVNLNAMGNCGSFVTNYTDATNSGGTQDDIFTFSNGNPTLMAAATGTGPFTYDWYVYNSATNSYDILVLNSSDTQAGLADGGYLVQVTDGAFTCEQRAWVYNTTVTSNAGADPAAICLGDNIMLDGSAVISTETYTYYDPVPTPIFFTGTSQFNIEFTFSHSYVGDLEFYLVLPDGSNVALSTGASGGAGSNTPPAEFVYTFTNDGTGTGTLGTGSTGTFTFNADNNATVLNALTSGGSGPGGEQNMLAGGWAVQIYDCVGADVGQLENAIIRFDADGDGTYEQVYDGTGDVTLPSAINDNSCTAGTASIYAPPAIPQTTQTVDNSTTAGVGIVGSISGGFEWSSSTTGATGPWSTPFENADLSPMVTPTTDTWYRLRVENSSGCITEDVVMVSTSTASPPCPATPCTASIAAVGNCGMFTTNYTDATNSGGTNDAIYTFSNGNPSLMASATGTGPFTYDWYVYDPATNAYEILALNGGDTQAGLADGGYLVQITDGNSLNCEQRAWVYNTTVFAEAGSAPAAMCAGEPVVLDGSATVSTETFTYYDPVPTPIFFNAASQFNIEFTFSHSYVGDLEFYLVLPDGSNVALSTGASGGAGSNTPPAEFVYTFTNDGTGTGTLGTGSTGTFTFNADNNATVLNALTSGGSGPGGEQNMLAGGWAVQIYDCVGADVGQLENAIIRFDADGDGTYEQVYDGTGDVALPSAINDNSCTAGTASIYAPPAIPQTTQTVDNTATTGVGIVGSITGGFEWSSSTTSATGPWSAPFENSTLSPTVNPEGDTWYRLQVENSSGCITEDVVMLSNIDCSGTINISDPCTCNDDATVNGNNGTFSEIVEVTTSAAGQFWTIKSITPNATPTSTANAFPSVSAGSPLTDNGGGSYTIQFNHFDAQGYTVVVEGPNAAGDAANYELSISNTCFYPTAQIVGAGFVCNTSDPITFQGTPNTGTTIAWAGTGITDNLDGTASFNPATAGVGNHTITYSFTGASATGTSSPGCLSEVSRVITVEDCSPNCQDYLLDLNPQFSAVCDGGMLDIGVSVTDALRDLIDPDCDGTTDGAAANLLLLGYDNVVNSLPSSPYPNGSFTTAIGPVTALLSGQSGAGCNYEPGITGVSLPAHSGGCNPETRIIYAYFDETVAASIGIDAECLPWVSFPVTIWPDPANVSVSVGTTDGCTTTFVSSCPNMIVSPSSYVASQGDAATNVNVTVSIPGNECAADVKSVAVGACEASVNCASYAVDISTALSNVCDGTAFDVDIPITGDVTAIIDDPANGGDGDGSINTATEDANLLALFQFGISGPNGNSANPYTTTPATVIAPDNVFGNLINPTPDGGLTINHTGGCNAEEYVIYAFLDLTVAATLGIDASCQPWASDIVTVWPDPANATVSVNGTAGCTTSFVSSCPNMIVSPSSYTALPGASATTINVTLSIPGNECAADVKMVNVPAGPTDAGFTFDRQTVCASAATSVAGANTITFTPTTSGGTYTVSPATGGTFLGNVFTANASADGAYEICYTTTATGSCSSSTECLTIYVVQDAVATLTSSITICEGQAYDLTDLFTATTTPGGTFSLSGGTDLTNPSVGTYDVTYTVGVENSCEESFTLSNGLVVQGNVDASFTYDTQTVCASASAGGNTITFVPVTAGGTYSVTPVTGGTFSGNVFTANTTAEGVYEICYTAPSGNSCNDGKECLTVSIIQDAVATLTSSITICEGQAYDLTDLFTATTTPGGTFSLSGGIDLTNPPVGTYDVTYTVGVENSCEESFTLPNGLVVQGNVDASFTYDTQTVCASATTGGNTITFVPVTGGGTYSVTPASGGTFVGNVFTSSTTAEGAYEICYTVASSNSCSDRKECLTVHVIQDAVATLTSPITICEGEPYNLTDLFTGTTTPGGVFSLSGGTDLTDPPAGTYDVTYTVGVENSCEESFTLTGGLIVNSVVDASFTYDTQTVCAGSSSGGNTITFSPAINGGSYTVTPVTGGTFAGNIFTANASADGAYEICYSVNSGNNCPNQTECLTVYIVQDAVATLTSSISICEGQAFDLTDLFTATTTPGGLFSLSGGVDLTNPPAGTYDVTYTVGIEGDCQESFTLNGGLVVGAGVDASFTYDTQTVCASAIPGGNTITFSPTTAGGTYTVIPATGGTFAGNIFTANSAADGAYEICYTVNSGNSCPEDKECVTIYVVGDAVATIASPISICEGDAFDLTDLFTASTTPGGVFALSGGTDLTNPPVGTYDVTYTVGVEGSCQESFTLTGGLVVGAGVDPTFTYDTQTICASAIAGGNTITFTPTTAGGTYTVAPATGGTFAGNVFTANSGADGVYEICYSLSSGNSCPSTSQCVTIYIVQDADASINDLTVCDDSILDLADLFTTATTPGGSFYSEDGTNPGFQSTEDLLIGNLLTIDAANAPYTLYYTVGVEGACFEVDMATVSVTDITGTINVTNTTCPGAGSNAADGELTLIPGGGTAPYTQLWSTGETTATIGGLTAGAYTVTLTDANGCQDVFASEIVETPDTTVPTATCQDITVQLDITGSVFIDEDNIDNGSMDECGSVSLSLTPTNFTCSNLGSNTVTLTVTDDSGNSTTCTATVTQVPAAGTPIGIGTTTVTLTATDGSNNTAMCTVSVTVEDTTAPSFTCPATQVVDLGANCQGALPDLVSLVGDESDNCTAAPTVSQSISAGTLINDDVTVLLTVSDAAGNTTSCEVLVSTQDVMPPVATCQDITVQLDITGSVFIGADDIDNGSTDNCVVSQLSLTPTNFTCSNLGSNTVTLTITDDSGNNTTCTATVTVEDNVDPIALCQDITVELDANGLASIAENAVDNGSFDNCASISNYDTDITDFTCSSVGNVVVTMTVTDANNLTSSCQANVLVEDNTAPTFTCPGTQTITSCNGIVPDLTALVTDASDACGIFSVIQTPVAGSDPGDLNGNTIVALVTVTDVNANVTACDVNIVVDDSSNPVFTNCPTTMTMIANDVDECSGKVNWSIPVAVDDCFTLDVTQTAGPTSGTIVAVGSVQTITYTATDSDNNTATCTFEVMVMDTQNPAFDADIVMPADATVECSDIPAAFILTNDDVNDNCTLPADLIISYTEVSTQGTDNTVCGPDGFYNYTITRTWSVTDDAGNVLTHVQTLSVEDTTAPIALCQDITIVLGTDGVQSITPADLDNGSNDNCAPLTALTFTVDNTQFDCNDTGENTVTLTVSDPCLNTSICTAVVTVEENPTVSCTPEYDAMGSDPCSCKNNATNLTDGQFDEFIQVIAVAGDTWNITASAGLFESSSAAPPAAPTPIAASSMLNGLVDGIDNDGDSVIDNPEEAIYYTLSGIHVDAIGYTLEVQSANFGTTFTFTNTCHYPTIDFANVPGELCLGTNLELALTEAFGGTGVTQFFVNGTALVDNEFIGTDWGLGMHTITAVFDAEEPLAYTTFTTGGVTTFDNAQTPEEALADPGCISEISTTINIVATPSQVACNDLINVTLEEDCETEIIPDMALEGTYGCYDDYIITLYQSSGAPLSPANIVNSTHIGEVLTFNLSHPLSGNLCWGEVLVEDKSAPQIICPDDLTIACTVDVDNLTITGAPVVMDCSDFTVDYYDAITENGPCAEPFTMSIVRTFVAVDAFGQADSCQQNILIQRPDLDDVVFPDDVAFSCEQVAQHGNLTSGSAYTLGVFPDHPDFTGVMDATGVNSFAALSASGAGTPTIDGLPVQGAGSCMLAVLESDELYDVCGANYEILRTWKVRDMCAPLGPDNPREMIQIIKVLDETGPVITVEDNIVVSANIESTDQEECTASFTLPVATVTDGCSEVTSVETIHPFGTNEENGGLVEGISFGNYNITYVAEDACGNISTRTVVITVIDDIAPTPVCDEIVQVVLGADGTATVLASTFDDGSSDNCGIQSMAVRRMNDACAIAGNTSFGPDVKFCCEDTGEEVMVALQVTDNSGNTNECMVEVLVEDKLAPIKVSDVTAEAILCDDYLNNFATELDLAEADNDTNPQILIDAFGEVVYSDNCETFVTTSWTRDVNTCGVGSITRTWNVEDAGGNVGETCTQIISISHVNDWNVEFPADQALICVADENEIEGLDFGEPTVFDDDCELIAISMEDELFNVVVDACYRISRTYTVINWCIYDGDNQNDDVTIDTRRYSDGGDGIVVYVQDITVQDDIAPVINIPTNTDYCIDSGTDNGDCTLDLELEEVSVADCSEDVTVTYEIVGVGTGRNFENISPGIYEVSVTAVDNCGNQSSVQYDIEVRDCKAPTPYCVSGLIVELMPIDADEDGIPEDGMVELWTTDLDAGSFDNCTSMEDLVITASAGSDNVDAASANIMFTCNEIGLNEVYLYVEDQAGNIDYCLTSVTVESVNDFCPEIPNEDPIITGVLATEYDAVLEGATISLNDSNIASSDAVGSFELIADEGTDVTVTPEHDVYDNSSVTTFDLVLIRQHILTTSLLDSPYKIIAADVNNSGSVTSLDLVIARQKILGVIDSYPTNTAWVFVDAAHEFAPDWILSDGYPAVTNFNNITGNQTADFVAVRVGDVNGSFGFSDTADERNSMIIRTEDAELAKGEEFTVEFSSSDLFIGYQFTLDFDNLELISIDGNKENFGVFTNSITTSFSEDKKSDKLFAITFKAKANLLLSEVLTLSSGITKAEAYSDIGTMNVILEFTEEAKTEFALYQNKPNPFREQTVVGFDLPSASEATLTITDVKGKILTTIQGEFDEGYNQVILNNEYKGGIYFYQLDTPDNSAIQKMIIMD